MDDDICGSPLFNSKVINLELEGSKEPKANKKSLCCEGKVLRTSRADMDVGDWVKTSTIL